LRQVANFIHTRGKVVQIVLTFLNLGTAVNWCHSFTKLTGAGEKCTPADSLSKLLHCFEHLYLLIYSSYILSQPASNDLTNGFINNLFNISEGGSIGGNHLHNSGGGTIDGDPLYNSGGGGLTDADFWYY
jgi:hypothetical protein